MFQYVTRDGSGRATLLAAASALQSRFSFLVPESSLLIPLARYLRAHHRLATQKWLAKLFYWQALPARSAATLDWEDVCEKVTRLYEQKKYSTIIVGSPNGGVAHLSTLLHAPFLPTHFLFSFRDRTLPDDIQTYFQHGRSLAKAILKENGGVEIINHFDPIHDRLSVSQVNHIRLKCTTLPESYKRFILEHLEEGGTVIFSACTYPWLQYSIDSHLFFQVGGLGGYSPEAFLEGAPDFPQQGFPKKGWCLEEYSPEERLESEWGISLAEEEVDSFCKQFGFRYVPLNCNDPALYGRMALRLYEHLIQRETTAKPHVLAFDCFTMLNPYFNVSTSLPSLWLPFYARDTFNFAKETLAMFPHYDVFYLNVVPSFLPPADLVPLDEWIQLLGKRGVVYLIGMEKDFFPVDFSGALRYPKQLRFLLRSLYSPFTTRAMIDDLIKISAHP